MGDRLWTAWLAFWLTLAPAAGFLTSATATTLAPSSIRITTIRIEPPRPGGIPGSPREIAPLRDVDAGSTLSTKPTWKAKRRTH